MLLIKIVAVVTASISAFNFLAQGHEETEEPADRLDYSGFYAKIIVYFFIIGYAVVGLYALWILVSEKNGLAIGAVFTCLYEISSYLKIPGALKNGSIFAKVPIRKRVLNFLATLPLLIFAFSN